MERSVAIKKLGKLLGKSLGYRVDPKAPDEDARAEARAKLTIALADRKALGEQREARKEQLLQADPEYQRLKAEHRSAGEVCQALSSIVSHYRFTVGVSSALFFTIKAQGDSWEEVIGKLTEKVNS